MDYAFWANTTAVIHSTVIVVTVFGLLLSFRYKRFRPWEAAIVIITILLWSYYGNCPLAMLEQHLRDMAGQQVNIASVGFTSYYAQKLLSIDIPSRIVQRTTFFTGGALFAASIEWLAPVMHLEIFKARKLFKRTIKKFA